MRQLSFYIHPHFIIKYYLFEDIRNVLKRYAFKGRVLDVGCGDKPYKSLFSQASSYLGIDFQTYSKNKGFTGGRPDFFFPDQYKRLGNLPFPSSSFNHTVCFQVLEHSRNPEMLVSELVRVTRRRGYILVTVPFIWGLHEEPHDYYRFTPYGVSALFERYNCDMLLVLKEGAIYSTLLILLIDTLIEFGNRNKIFYIFALILFPFLLLFSYSALLVDRVFPSSKIYANTLFLAKKRT